MEPIGLTHRLLEEITDNFSEEQKIGQGAYGKVYRGEDRNGEEIAVKMLHYVGPGIDDKQFQNEFKNLRKLNHQNIVKLIGYCYETQYRPIEYNGIITFAEQTYRALCLEYLHNGSLQKHLSDEYDGLDWHTRYKIIKGTCEGLKYLHEAFEKTIYHLDLKPDNILLDKSMVPKLADFGLSRLFSNEQTRITQSLTGTFGYLPPEYIERGLVSKKLDIFSLGVVMIKIISGPNGRSKSAEMPPQEVIDLVHANWRNRLQAKWSDSSLEAYCQQVMRCTEIALRCMQIDRHNRPNIVDIIQELTEMENAIDEAPPIEPLDNHQLSLDDLHAIKLIGKSSSGVVQLVHHKWTGQFFALKVIQLNIQKSIRRKIAQELQISLSTQCQYVVVCYQCFYVNGVILIVFEYMDGGSLADFLKTVKTIPESYLAAICKQVLKGLMYLHHEKNIIHRHLKPSNILINHLGEVKISNFGVRAIIASSNIKLRRHTFIGTYNYMAPERISGQKHGYMSDIWSLGLVMLECATGKFPYPPRDSFYELLEAVVDQPPPSAPSGQFSAEFCSFINACLQKDATDRSSAQVLSTHPFLSLYDDLNIDLASYFTTAGSPLGTFNAGEGEGWRQGRYRREGGKHSGRMSGRIGHVEEIIERLLITNDDE